MKMDTEIFANHTNRFFVKDDKSIPRYRTWDFKRLKWHSRPYEYQYVLEIISSYSDNLRVLDFGCGNNPGYLMLADLENVSSVDALDTRIKVIKNLHKHPKVNKILSNILDLKEDETYDVIASISTIEHVVPYQDTIKKSHSLLRTGGLLVMTLDIYDGKKPYKRIRNIQPHDYKLVIESAGFRILGTYDDKRSKQDLTGSNSHFPGAHKKLRTFRFCCLK